MSYMMYEEANFVSLDKDQSSFKKINGLSSMCSHFLFFSSNLCSVRYAQLEDII